MGNPESYPNLSRWTRPKHYAGKTWEGFYSAGVGQSAASDALERSNFKAMVEALSGTVEIVRESHWAVGWVEWIAIAEDDHENLRIANELAHQLEDYPILDEEALSAEEQEEADETWANCYSPTERLKYIRAHRSQFEFRSIADALGCVRGKYFAGYASELIAR